MDLGPEYRHMAGEKLTTRAEDYSQWYLAIVLRAGLSDNSAGRGCMGSERNG